MVINLAVVLADMLRIPTVTPVKTIGKRGFGAFERHISAAHNIQTKIFETMLEMEGHPSRKSAGIYACDGSVDCQDVVLKRYVSVVYGGIEASGKLTRQCN